MATLTSVQITVQPFMRDYGSWRTHELRITVKRPGEPEINVMQVVEHDDFQSIFDHVLQEAVLALRSELARPGTRKPSWTPTAKHPLMEHDAAARRDWG